MRLKLLLVPVLIATSPLAACKSRHDGDSSHVGQDLDRARDRLAHRLQTRLATLDTKLAALRADLAARSDELTAEGKDNLNDAIAKLEAKRAEAQDALDETRHSSADRLDELNKRANDVLKDIDDTYDDVVKKLRE
jgi:Skp family chaperone for outer membrane proteins